jgi:hypothetical protein
MENWLCPVCKNKLIKTGEEFYQTGSEHVCDPNREINYKRSKYECSDTACISRKLESFWNVDGELYGGTTKIDGKYVSLEDYCIGKNPGPFGTLERKLNVEIYKKGLKSKTYLHPFLTLWIYKPYIDYHYISNYNGDVLKKGWEIKYLKKDDRNGNYCIGVVSCFSIWKFLWKKFKRKSKNQKLDFEKDIKNRFNRDWIHRWFETFILIFYKKRLTNYGHN